MIILDDILNATGGKLINKVTDSFSGVSIDSRTIKEGELFFALRGERLDGHDFLKDALSKGSGAVVHKLGSDNNNFENKTIILVSNTLLALQKLALYIRIMKNVPVIAVTGSNGKTTTKELIAAILSKKYKVLKNQGNLNNHIGLPLSLTGLEDEHNIVVLEMGASARGDIKELCRIAIPDCGVLTNIGTSHIEGFKDIETIRDTKLEILETVKSVIVNVDDRFLIEGIYISQFKGVIIRYGIENSAEVRASDIKLFEKGSRFLLRLGDKGTIKVRTKLAGRFNIYNILAASAVGYFFNVDIEDIKMAIEEFEGVPMRLRIVDRNGLKFMVDVYNANPASMEAVIYELARIKSGRAIAVLGDMLELGDISVDAHRYLGRLLKDLKIEVLIGVGKFMEYAVKEFMGEAYLINSSEEAGELLRHIMKDGDTILVKGSRGMKMEKVLEGYAI